LTQPAPRFGPIHKSGREQRFSANAATRPRERSHRFQAAFTNGEPGNPDQRGIADTAIGRKKRKKEARRSMLCPMARTCGMTQVSPYSKASTAEDGLPQPGEQLEAPAWLAIASIDAAQDVMQRGCQCWSRRKIDSRVCRQERRVPALERRGIGSCDGSNCHSGLISASEEAKTTSRRSLEAGNGRPRARRSSDNGIPARSGTMRRAIPGETRYTSRPESSL
jgi:hypothetical protein